MLFDRLGHHSNRLPRRSALRRTRPSKRAIVKAAHRLNHSSGLLALSVLLDSANEHYRGQFHNKAMVTPLVTSALSLIASAHGVADQRRDAHRGRHLVFALAALTGIAGTGFHIYNISKKPGGFCWQNLFYSAPLGAPGAILLSGLIGLMAERVRAATFRRKPMLFGMNAGRFAGLVTAASLLGTTGEAALLHLRGAFHNPFMFAPVTIPPIGAGLLAAATLNASRCLRRFTRAWLSLTAAMGIAGAGFHIYGVSRAMGGWRNWRQNMVDGPPIPAPPSFTALALAGLAALQLLKTR